MKLLSALVLTLVAALSLMPVAAPAQSSNSSKAKVQQKQKQLRSALGSLREKRRTVATQLRRKEAASDHMRSEIHGIDRQINAVNARIRATNERLARAQRESNRLSRELKAQEAKLAGLRRQIEKRVRSMHTQGQVSRISALVGTRSFGELASRQGFLRRIADEDKRLFAQARVLHDAISLKKRAQDNLARQARALRDEQRAQAQELNGLRSRKKSIFNILAAEVDQLEDRLEDMERESRRIESQIAAIQAASSGATRFTGRFIRPSSGRLTSGFGMRVHPITGRRRMHAGVDIAAPTGTPIRAAAAGRVIIAGYMGGYGYTVVVDHGGGYSTLYGHCSSLLVRVGQQVRQGQQIARMGSTGMSTGPHLHFEVRINGRPVNPRQHVRL